MSAVTDRKSVLETHESIGLKIVAQDRPQRTTTLITDGCSTFIDLLETMPSRDLHTKPFDEGTNTKLGIYRGYIRAWLQVFLHSEKFRGKSLQFYDFFSGPGRDSNGVDGSPMILLHELQSERPLIEERGHRINIIFNDSDVSKISNLKRLCEAKEIPWDIQYEQLEFAQAFEKHKNKFGNAPSLVFIDQNGLKHITKDVFARLTATQTTDFIFFTASSFKRRFGELLAPEINFPQDVPHSEVHRALADVYRGWAPDGIDFIGGSQRQASLV